MYEKRIGIGYEKNLIFCFWTDNNKLSKNRINALKTIERTGLNIIFLDAISIKDWELSSMPFHAAYKFLSPTHKADYLRSYFLHHYGGGYTDIKFHTYSWLNSIQMFKSSDDFLLGYREKSPIDIARGRGMIKDIHLCMNYYKLIGCGAFFGRNHSQFSEAYLNKIHSVLDAKIVSLKKYPSKDPLDYLNKKKNDGELSNYPLEWSEICGQIFHPIGLKFYQKISKHLPRPDFHKQYR